MKHFCYLNTITKVSTASIVNAIINVVPDVPVTAMIDSGDEHITPTDLRSLPVNRLKDIIERHVSLGSLLTLHFHIGKDTVIAYCKEEGFTLTFTSRGMVTSANDDELKRERAKPIKELNTVKLVGALTGNVLLREALYCA